MLSMLKKKSVKGLTPAEVDRIFYFIEVFYERQPQTNLTGEEKEVLSILLDIALTASIGKEIPMHSSPQSPSGSGFRASPSSLLFLILTRVLRFSPDLAWVKAAGMVGAAAEAFLIWNYVTPLDFGIQGLMLALVAVLHPMLELLNPNLNKGSPFLVRLQPRLAVFGFYWALSPLYASHPLTFFFPILFHFLVDLYQLRYLDFQFEWVTVGVRQIVGGGATTGIRLPWLKILLRTSPYVRFMERKDGSHVAAIGAGVPATERKNIFSLQRQLESEKDGGVADKDHAQRKDTWKEILSLSFGQER
jgi:hypothetical protein